MRSIFEKQGDGRQRRVVMTFTNLKAHGGVAGDVEDNRKSGRLRARAIRAQLIHLAHHWLDAEIVPGEA